MKLSELFVQAAIPFEGVIPGECEVGSIEIDSRKVVAGSLFCAVRGTRLDGNDWADRALVQGACAIVTDRTECRDLPGRILVASVPDSVGPLCRALCRDPLSGLPILAVTGTNGKTSSAFLAESIFQEAGWAPALSSTVAMRYPGHAAVADMTTPDAVTLWDFLAKATSAGARSLVLETSSHALHQGRLAGIEVQAAVFTNLTRDHLDYHGSVDAYFEAKVLLFTRHLRPDGIAVVNADDEHGRLLMRRLGGRALGVSTGAGTDYRIADLSTTMDGNRFRLVSKDLDLALESPLLGEVFARNLAGVAVAALRLGASPEAVRRAAARTTVPGRLQLVKGVVLRGAVDYAHTPDALERLLEGLRPLVPGKLVCVFGCGGDRDKGKRPLMGGIANRLSDLAVATSDNPRTEDPEAILDQVCAGFAHGTETVRISDRREAIRFAASRLSPGDFLVVAGKGHEDYQIVGGEKRHFDDVEELSRALRDAEVACPA